ncbi:MAG: ABC transporter ATP-binding protein/permease [Anaerolineae bacterium]|nr:ABC transporter ATP-binding protein/permease [Anaerolineae bacterium]NUQ02853.1 ABC transporter ATP-binding protein [Anaerolineae bacterium]
MSSSSIDARRLSAVDLQTEKITDRYLFRMLGQFLAPYRGSLALVFVGLVIVSILSTALPYLVQQAVDGPIAAGDLDGLIPFGLLYFGVVIAIFVLRFGYIYLLQTVGQNTLRDLRARLFEHILRQDMRFFNVTPVGQLVSRMTNDIDALTELVSTSVVMVATNMVTLIGIIIAMLLINARLALIAFIVLPVMIGSTVYFRKRIRQASNRYHRLVAEKLAFLNEQFSGMLVIQLFGRQAVSRAGFKEKNDAYREVHTDLRDYYTWYASTLQVLITLGLALVLYAGGEGVFAGWVTLGMLIAFVDYTRRMFEPIQNLAEQIAQVQTALSAGERLARMLHVEPSVEEPAQPAATAGVALTVEFDHVTFAYEEGHPVIQDLVLHIPAGQRVAIVGATGAGKTSLAGLVGRFYDVTQGAVRVGGVDVRQISAAELRRMVTIVPQNPYCFTGTIAENISLFDTAIPRERIIQAARTACASRFIERLPQGLDTPLLPGGANLSQGQRQLIALARALLHHPDSILVLDEATSSIDTETEEDIQTGLHRVLQGRTSIVIAHRLSTVRQVDRILVMQRGKIVEEGTHDTLLTLDGLYAQLYQRQFIESEEAI